MAEIELENIELQMLLNDKESGFNYQQPRHDPWRENYELYRDHVTINRLTQRQSVNLPIMKTTLRTLLKDIDDMPVIVFENLDNDKEAEVFQNEYWKWTLEQNNAEIQDVVDKKQDFFFGRTFDSWQIKDGRIVFDIEDPVDILVDRYMNPYDLDSSRFLIHTHIFKPLSSLKNNPEYDQNEVKSLEEFFETEMGLVKASDNQNSLQVKNQKLANLGVTDIDDPVLGETYVELTMYRRYRPKGDDWKDNKDGKKYKLEEEQLMHYVEAENRCILMKKPQEKIIGVTRDHYWRNHYNYNTWGDDIDKQDFWTDGIADIVRTPNKVQNAWFSQEIERRTLSNFGMTFFNSSLQADGFMPNTWEPRPFGFYGIPLGPNGKLSDNLQRVEIPMNDGNLESITFINQMIEKATGATATQQGAQTERQVTLGEVELAQGEAKARTQGISKFYTHAWKKRAEKFLKLIEAAPEKLDAVKIYKKGKNSEDIYAREIVPGDWMTKAGYRVRVWAQDEKNEKDTQSIQKLQIMKTAMPDNPKVNEIYVRKLAEFSDVSPDDVKEILDYESKKLAMMAQMGATMGQQPGQGTPQGGQIPQVVPQPIQ